MTFLRELKPFEKILLIYFLILSLIILIFSPPFASEYKYIFVNIFFFTLILIAAKLHSSYLNKYTKFIRYWLPIFLFTFIYRETYPLIHIIYSGWFDPIFSKWDITIFGVNLGLWIEQFDHPLLNELFRLGYVSYYAIIVVGSGIHYFRGDQGDYEKMLSQVTLAFCISYLMFLLLPTQGPRFYNAPLFSTEMNGLFISHIQKKIIEVAAFPGGAFPSSHIAVVILIWFSFYKKHPITFFVLSVLSILLILGTIWGRYHYAIDAIAGILLAMAIYYSTPLILGKS